MLTGRAHITSLNRRYLGHEGATDVIAFDLRPAAGLPPPTPAQTDEPGALGEIYVCLDVAREAARREGTSLTFEVVLYIVHGLLHLAGLDDTTPVARRRMRAAERRIMHALQTEIGLEGVFAEPVALPSAPALTGERR